MHDLLVAHDEKPMFAKGLAMLVRWE